MHSLILKKGRDSSLKRWHPWVFSGSVASLEGSPDPGETVMIKDHAGRPLASAAYSPQSQIRARIWSFDINQKIDESFFHDRITLSVQRRDHISQRSAYRIVYGESDCLPGLIVDKYGDYLVCQLSTAGMEFWRQTVIATLAGAVTCAGIYERSDANSRKREGLSQRQGTVWGNEPPDEIIIDEFGLRFSVSLHAGHKTGFYIDQAENRRYVRGMCDGLHVLDCFSYTGGFGVSALCGGARQVVNVDSSAAALELADGNFRLNGLDKRDYHLERANVFELLRQYRDAQRRFDVIILDPPKLAETKSQLQKAARAYKDLALQAACLLNPGGYLLTFSCSGAIDIALFQKITADAFLDAGRNARVIRYLFQGEDHPVGLPFPEGLYLKGLVCRVD